MTKINTKVKRKILAKKNLGAPQRAPNQNFEKTKNPFFTVVPRITVPKNQVPRSKTVTCRSADRQTDRQTDGRTDGRTDNLTTEDTTWHSAIQLIPSCRRPIRKGGINITGMRYSHHTCLLPSNITSLRRILYRVYSDGKV